MDLCGYDRNPENHYVGGKPFNTKHKLNECKHIKPVKQKKRGLGLDRNEAIAEADEDKTAFFTENGVFCYRKMPFGLKNAGATYQRLVNKVPPGAYTVPTERDKRLVPIYFVSRVLQGAELNYPGLEKLILALVHAARRLRRYFQAHLIWVLTDKPIKQTFAKPEKSGRITKWVIELGEHEIKFKDRDSVKRASSFDGSGAGLMLISSEGKEYTYALRFKF
ncbi:reverse transcriptase domain-containing protein [Tanacetum coccineum]